MMYLRRHLTMTMSNREQKKGFSIAAVLFLVVFALTQSSLEDVERTRQHLYHDRDKDDPYPFTIMADTDGVCLNGNLTPKLHDRRPHYHKLHKQQIETFIYTAQMVDREMPALSNISNANFVILKINSKPTASAWNDSGFVQKGAGWVDPPPEFLSEAQGKRKPDRILEEGNYVAFFSWFIGNYGHFLHDNLPNIAWLRNTVPPGTRFILPSTAVSRRVLQFLDPEFEMSRVEWIKRHEVVHIKGTLTVVTPDMHPIIMGQNLMNHLRSWIHEKHSFPEEQPEERTVVFYSRAGASTKHGRILEANHERQVLNVIQQAMHRYGRKERLVVFNGQIHPKNGLPHDMSVRTQFNLFRSATAIIGPHGSGIANMIWADPSPISCDTRTQVLEFIGGPDSIVQPPGNFEHNYYVVFRGMPLDYHQIVYTADSNMNTTFVDINELKGALDAMWNNPRITATMDHVVSDFNQL